MRVRVAATCLTTSLTLAGLLAGCAQRPLPQAEQIAPDPFGYLKRSAVCTPGPIATSPEGQSVSIALRSDDGTCDVVIAAPGGGPYASFLLTTLPLHGKSFIYDYNKQTYVTYTADHGYAGTDAFAVGLVPGGGKPRTVLHVALTVDATGVAQAEPPVIEAKPEKKTTVHRKTRHVVHHHKALASKSAQ